MLLNNGTIETEFHTKYALTFWVALVPLLYVESRNF